MGSTTFKGPGSSRVVLMLSRAFWALSIFFYGLKNIVDPSLGARAPVAPLSPPPPPLGSANDVVQFDLLADQE